jgi:hypothetical protein
LPGTLVTGQIFRIKNIGTGTLTVGRNSKLIDGDPNDIYLIEDEPIEIQSDGTEWWII